MSVNRERWQTAVADKAVRAAISDERVRDALVAHKVNKSMRTRHDLVTALAATGIGSTRERDRIVQFLERTPKFDSLISEAIRERMT